VLRLVSSLVV
jgi:hypothetical protein